MKNVKSLYKFCNYYWKIFTPGYSRKLTNSSGQEHAKEEHFIPTAPSVLSKHHKRQPQSSNPHNGHNSHHSPRNKLPDNEQAGKTPKPVAPVRMDSTRQQMEKSKASQVCLRMCYYSQNNV